VEISKQRWRFIWFWILVHTEITSIAFGHIISLKVVFVFHEIRSQKGLCHTTNIIVIIEQGNKVDRTSVITKRFGQTSAGGLTSAGPTGSGIGHRHPTMMSMVLVLWDPGKARAGLIGWALSTPPISKKNCPPYYWLFMPMFVLPLVLSMLFAHPVITYISVNRSCYVSVNNYESFSVLVAMCQNGALKVVQMVMLIQIMNGRLALTVNA